MFARKQSSRRVARRRHSLQALLEGLESRIVLSTFNVATESELRAALTAADSNGAGSNLINVTGSISLTDTTAGEREIDNTTSTPETLTIEGQGTKASSTVISGSSTWNTRIFEVGAAPARR